MTDTETDRQTLAETESDTLPIYDIGSSKNKPWLEVVDSRRAAAFQEKSTLEINDRDLSRQSRPCQIERMRLKIIVYFC